jgi:shikimate kinase
VILRRLLLVGFMGSGKSTVGPLLARSLGWRFEDFDAHVERAEGRPIREIFARDGEAYFRAVEARVADALLAEDDVVLASGGGWAARPGRLQRLPEGTASVWLRVSPEAVVARAGGGDERPLLAGPDPLARARDLLAEREHAYGAAQVAVDTDGLSPIDVTEKILALLERSGHEITPRTRS